MSATLKKSMRENHSVANIVSHTHSDWK